jgi:hypothetical protein
MNSRLGVEQKINLKNPDNPEQVSCKKFCIRNHNVIYFIFLITTLSLLLKI